jgi:anti-anti-sigma factor
MERFRVSATPDGDTCTLTLSGEVDLAVAPDVVDLGSAALDDPSIQTLRVGLHAVTFMDSTCIGALIELRNTADKLGKTVVLDGAPPRVQRLLDLTGLGEFFVTSGETEPGTTLSGPADPDPQPQAV